MASFDKDCEEDLRKLDTVTNNLHGDVCNNQVPQNEDVFRYFFPSFSNMDAGMMLYNNDPPQVVCTKTEPDSMEDSTITDQYDNGFNSQKNTTDQCLSYYPANNYLQVQPYYDMPTNYFPSITLQYDSSKSSTFVSASQIVQYTNQAISDYGNAPINYDSSAHHGQVQSTAFQYHSNVPYFVAGPCGSETQPDVENQWDDETEENISKDQGEKTETEEPIGVGENSVEEANKENMMPVEDIQEINSKYTHQRFPIKLWNLATDPAFKPIKWSDDGLSLIIDEYNLEPNLGYFFRSKKFSSFLRQLHLYGFRKVTRARTNRSSHYHPYPMEEFKCREDCISEYQCSFFQRDRFDLVKKVRRFYGPQQQPQSPKNVSTQSSSQHTNVSSTSSNSSVMSHDTETSPMSISIPKNENCMDTNNMDQTTTYEKEYPHDYYGSINSIGINGQQGDNYYNYGPEVKYEQQQQQQQQYDACYDQNLKPTNANTTSPNCLVYMYPDPAQESLF